MAVIALFHSVLGMRPGVLDAAQRFRDRGHEVEPVDQYEGRVFDDYAEGMAYAEGIGYPALMERAVDGVAGLSDGFICVGFSNGGGMSEFVATRRAVGGVVLCSGALPLETIGVDAWPAEVPAQIHYMEDDPFRIPGEVESVAAAVTAAGADLDVYHYPGSGHLFTDPSLPAEYDRDAAELLWRRLFSFCRQYG